MGKRRLFCALSYFAKPVGDGTQVCMGLLLRRIQLSWKTSNGLWNILAVYPCDRSNIQ